MSGNIPFAGQSPVVFAHHALHVSYRFKNQGVGGRCVPAGGLEVLSKTPQGNCSINTHLGIHEATTSVRGGASFKGPPGYTLGHSRVDARDEVD
jgi:hypothetical protein